MKKQLFFTLALYCCTLLSFGQNFNFLGINFTVTSATTAKVGDNNGFIGAANIPATVSYDAVSYTVTSIGNDAFASSYNLTSVTIPNSVTNIGDLVFYNCSGLTAVTIPNSVISIGANAFDSCTGLISVSIPNSVTSIGINAFYYCIILTSVTIPNSVTSIGNYAFNSCYSLTSVSVRWDSPLPIDSTVFGNITLSNVALNVPSGKAAFYDAAVVWTDFGTITETVVAPILEQTFIANGINYIVTKATLPYEVAVHTHTSFSGAANIPASVSNAGNTFLVTSIGDYAFYNCTGLTSVTILNSVTSISEGAFVNCTGLTSVTIPNSVTSIGDGAFVNCTGLTSVTIPNSVTSIGLGTFYDCTGLTSISIPNSVTSIGQQAFYSCTGLTSVTVNWTAQLPNINPDVFAYVTLGNVALNVPSGTAALYDATPVWTNFNIIFPLTATQSQSNVSCFGGDNGTAAVVASGGNAPYNYLWSTGWTFSPNEIDLTAGTYTCTITDALLNSITLTFTITEPVDLPDNVTIVTSCGSYFWANDGLTYYTSGVYQGTTTNCVTEKLNLTIIPNSNNITTATACGIYLWNGTFYNESGIYTGETTNCVTEKLNLTITPNSYNFITVSACDSYVFNGETLTQSATYFGTANANCITDVLTLTITPSTTLIQANSACVSYTWPVNGETYTESGTYTAVNGCQTTIMNLTIIQPVTINFTETACDSYFWSRNDATYTTSGTYTFVSSCLTSILNLTINTSTTNTTSVSAVGNYIWPVNGETLSTTLTGYEFPNGNCNTEILNLTIIPATITITNENGVLNAVTNAPNATYQWYNCVSELNIEEQTSATFTPTQSGSYNVIIRINGILSGSAGCFNYTFLANNTFSGIAGIDLYPNPSNGIINLKLPTDLQVEIYNNLGQLLSTEKMFSGSNVINIVDKPTGVYFLKANDGVNVSTFKIIKN